VKERPLGSKPPRVRSREWIASGGRRGGQTRVPGPIDLIRGNGEGYGPDISERIREAPGGQQPGLGLTLRKKSTKKKKRQLKNSVP